MKPKHYYVMPFVDMGDFKINYMEWEFVPNVIEIQKVIFKD